jgi:predicted permease
MAAAVEREIDDELRFHLERQAEAHRQSGLSAEDADRQARLDLGGLEPMKEAYRDALGVRLVGETWRDMTLAVRALRATPVVTAIAVVSLALGIGATTAMFSIMESLFLRTLPVREPTQLVLITDGAPTHVRAWSYAVWHQIEQRHELFERAGAWSFTKLNLASGGEARLVDGMWATGSLFDTLGVPATLGRSLSESDDSLGGGIDGPVAVISDGFWRREFGGSPDVLGRSITVEGVPFTVVGVSPPSFSGPEVGRRFDLALPLSAEPLLRGGDSYVADGGITFLTIIARLRSGQSVDQATMSLRQVQSQIRYATLGSIARLASPAGLERYLRSPFALVSGAAGYAGARDIRGAYKGPLATLIVIAGLLLVVACVNVANLLGARATSRRHDLSIRLALGASRSRLVRQLVAESVLLYGLGASLGLAVATWLARGLAAEISGPGNAVFLDLSVNGFVLGFTSLLAMGTVLLFGTAPALRASRVAPIAALKDEGRAATRASRRRC